MRRAPRGISKEKAALDHWLKDIAPSTELRKWFAHDPKRWEEFRRRYAAELRQHSDLVTELRSLARHGQITLVHAAHDEAHNARLSCGTCFSGETDVQGVS